MRPAALYQGDCTELLVRLGVRAELVLGDPPFGRTQHAWDKKIEAARFWAAINACTRPTSTVALFADMKLAAEVIPQAKKHGWPFRYDLVWEKNKSTGFLNKEKQPLRAHEHVLVFYRERGIFNPQKTEGHKPSNSAHRRPGSIGKGYRETKGGPGYEQGKTWRYPRSVLPFKIVNGDDPDRRHPSQKPIELLRWLIRTFTNEGDLVIDPCTGSATTLEAALLEHRYSIGIELEPSFVEADRVYFRSAWGFDPLSGAAAEVEEEAPRLGHGEDARPLGQAEALGRRPEQVAVPPEGDPA